MHGTFSEVNTKSVIEEIFNPYRPFSMTDSAFYFRFAPGNHDDISRRDENSHGTGRLFAKAGCAHFVFSDFPLITDEHIKILREMLSKPYAGFKETDMQTLSTMVVRLTIACRESGMPMPIVQGANRLIYWYNPQSSEVVKPHKLSPKPMLGLG